MLILTRRVGETLMIGDDITVTVLGVKGNQVRIGVNAPSDVGVHREEIYDKMKAEQGNRNQPVVSLANQSGLIFQLKKNLQVCTAFEGARK